MYNYSEKHNILFVHIPKNAGTSIINSLEMTNTEHYPLSVLQGYMDKETFDNAIKIAVIRNPWERMVSYYRYRQLKNQDPQQALIR
jgi:chondroitin 4-sulfotransferase 11